MKSKNRAQALTSRLAICLLPIAMTMSVCFIRGRMADYVTDILRPAGSSLIYIPMLIEDSLIAFIGLSLFVVYILIIRKHTLRAIVFCGTGTAFLLCMATLLGPTGIYRYNKILQTLSTSDHTYQLVQQAICHHGCSYNYIVLECDSAGWICHNYGTSSRTSVQPVICIPHIPAASLAQNDATDGLELTVDGKTHVLHPADDISIYPRTIEFCGPSMLER